MDFYTIKTSVDIATDYEAFCHVVSAVGFFSQPLIVGEPVAEDGSYMFRFAVRNEGLLPYEPQLIENLSHIGFTPENTELIRAARI
jgi:hypothetical protein